MTFPTAWRRTCGWAAALLLPLAVALAPIVVGGKTLFLRDIASVHLPLEIERAQLVGEGVIPFVATARAGGQALIGNLATAALYPTGWFAAWLGPDASLMARFWLHLLLAGPAFVVLGARLGLDQPGRWVAGAVWATGGFALSHLAFANLVAALALAPALAAALLAQLDGSRLARLALGLCWTLLLLSGDPPTAALALLAAAILATSRGRAALPQVPAALGALALGTLVAAPQLVETWRILSVSARGFAGFSAETSLLASFDPRQTLDLLLPFAFGRPDLVGGGGFWGQEYHQGYPPFYFTLFPGALVLAATVVGLRRLRRAEVALLAVGLFLAFGAFNPLMNLLARLPGADLLRFPIKAWLLVAMGLALATGRATGDVVILRRALLAVAAVGATLVFVLANPTIGDRALAALAPDGANAAFLTGERTRLLVAALLVTTTAVVSWLLLRRRAQPQPLLIAWHATTQLLLLAPAYPMLDRTVLAERPPLADSIPEGARVVQGDIQQLFGSPASIAAPTADGLAAWLFIRAARQLYPVSGVRQGLRYELDVTPEGLGTWSTRLAEDATSRLDDHARLRLLRAWGVDALVLSRALDPPLAVVARDESYGAGTNLYRVPDTTAEVFTVGRARGAIDPQAALVALVDHRFDPRGGAVVAGEAFNGVAAVVTTTAVAANRLDVDLEPTPSPTLLVWQRAWLPTYRASADGVALAVEVANLHHIAVRVPAGVRHVSIAIDTRPWWTACAVAAVALFGLVLWSAGGLARREAAG